MTHAWWSPGSASWSRTTLRTADRSGIVRDAAVVDRGRTGGLGGTGRAGARGRRGVRPRRAGRSSRASSTRTRHLRLRRRPRRGVRRPDGGTPLHGRRHPRPRWPRPGRRPTSSWPRTSRGCVAEMRRQGTTTVEIKSGYGLTVARRGALARGRAAVHRRDDVPRCARRAAGVRRRTRRLRRPGHRADARAAAHRMRGGSTCSASAAPSTPTRRGRCWRPGAAAGLLGRACTPTSSGTGPACSWPCELGAAAVDHCTFLSRRGRRRPRRRRRRSRRCFRVSSSPPGRPTRTRAPLLEAGVTVALATDCNPGSCYTTSMPLCIALAVREMRMTPAEAAGAATAGGAAALRRDDVGQLQAGARADLAVLAAPSHLHLAYRPGCRWWLRCSPRSSRRIGSSSDVCPYLRGTGSWAWTTDSCTTHQQNSNSVASAHSAARPPSAPGVASRGTSDTELTRPPDPEGPGWGRARRPEPPAPRTARS